MGGESHRRRGALCFSEGYFVEIMTKLKIFGKKELRNDLYFNFLKMIKKGFQAEAFLLMMATWNFARFRYAVRTFNLVEFEKKIKQLEPVFKKFYGKDFKTINFDDYSSEIKKIFNVLAGIKGIEKTGATKLMHLKDPKVFVMWDGYIRNYYGFKKGDYRDYIAFLKLMQEKFENIKPKSGRTPAKLIDEHNYITITRQIIDNKQEK